MIRSEHTCITCRVALIEGLDGNWYPSFVGKRHYKCKECYDKRRIENKIKQKERELREDDSKENNRNAIESPTESIEVDEINTLSTEEAEYEKWINKNYEIKGTCISPISRQRLKGLKIMCEEEGFAFNPKQKCGKFTINNGPCCKEHQYRVSEVLSKWDMFPILIQKYWEEGLDCLNFDNNITLTNLFQYLEGSFYDIHKINLSKKRIMSWYRTTQKEKGHPVEVLDNHYSHLIGRTGYLEVWKKFAKGKLKTSREKVREYLIRYPGAFASEVHEKTEVDYSHIYEYVEQENLNLGARKKDELKVKIINYVKKNPETPADLVAHELGTTKSTVVKYCEQNNIHVEGMKEKPSMYKRKISDRWK